MSGFNNLPPDLSITDLQANILKSHRKEQVVCLFLQFENEKQKVVRNWISDFAEKITSAEAQETGVPIVRCFFLSGHGFKKLNARYMVLNRDNYFRAGMKDDIIRRKMNDISYPAWERNYWRNLDAMIMIASGGKSENPTKIVSKIQHEVSTIRNSLDETGAGRIRHEEWGKRIRNQQRKVIEHFGFVDGISQPDNWKNVLIKEKKGRYGSYLVFRKIKQDVAGFDKEIIKLANQLDIAPQHARAQVFGRFRDGTPLTLKDKPETVSGKKIENNFDYSNDVGGEKCPFHSHIRKTHPRNDNENSERRRILRRGITYGDINENKENVGLLFMSYQASIRDQFGVILGEWVNNPNYPEHQSGIDPIIGRAGNNSTKQDIGQNWNRDYNQPKGKKERFDFRDVTTFLGGEWFYAPSLPFLLNLHYGRGTSQTSYSSKTSYTFGHSYGEEYVY